MKTKLYIPYVILVGSLISCVISNAMDLTKVSPKTWSVILHNNHIEGPKATLCVPLMPKFIRTHPESVNLLSTLQNKSQAMKFAVLNAVCDELISASKKGEL